MNVLTVSTIFAIMIIGSIVFGACVSVVFSQTIPCGVPTVQPITNRIVGGQVARPGSWPWIVLLEDDLGFISGSGVIIDHHVILTSAQHFESHRFDLGDLDLRLWKCYIGKHNLTIKDPHEIYVHIRKVIIHPGYNYSSLENDIALIVTSEAMIYTDYVRPACLPDASHAYTVGQTCYLPGWGSTRDTGSEDVLNQVDLPILDDSVCKQEFPQYLPATELCAGYKNQGKDWCGDDIGSPLMCKDQSGVWYVQGLASSGGNCTSADQPSAFEDIPVYSDWVKQTMQAAGYPYQF